MTTTAHAPAQTPLHHSAKPRLRSLPGLLPAMALALALTPAAAAAEPFVIEVIDAENGWPVPLIALTTTHGVEFHTDNAGVAAIDLPEVMGRSTWFTVSGQGYEAAADGFGTRGARLTPQPGGTATIEVHRTNVAKRLGRLTGGGIFAESQKAGRHLDWQESGILGSDSIQIVEHRGRRFWAWGDSVLLRYPLGLFHMSGATTDPRPLTSFEPPIKLELDYFRDDEGLPRNIAELDGPGPTWLSGFASLPDADGEFRMVAHFAKIKPPLDAYRSGLCVWNEDSGNFEQLLVLWEKDTDGPERPPAPDGHPVAWTDEDGGEWLLFGNPLPRLKVSATFEAWQDPQAWQVLEPQAAFESAEDGAEIRPHSGSVAWNDYRQRWITVFMQWGGEPTMFGELWYAEADSPFGPWGTAVRVLSHQDYTFYNPRVHQELTPEGSPVLLFEGTYTTLFSDAPRRTPRHDYNQILYRLDLDDPALAPARGE